MIPTMILFGVVTGWWWRVALIGAAVVWPVILAVGGVIDWSWPFWQVAGTLLGGSLLAVLNAAVGMLLPQAIRWGIRMLRRKPVVAVGLPSA